MSQTTLFSDTQQLETGLKEVHSFANWDLAVAYAREQLELDKWNKVTVMPPGPDGSHEVVLR